MTVLDLLLSSSSFRLSSSSISISNSRSSFMNPSFIIFSLKSRLLSDQATVIDCNYRSVGGEGGPPLSVVAIPALT